MSMNEYECHRCWPVKINGVSKLASRIGFCCLEQQPRPHSPGSACAFSLRTLLIATTLVAVLLGLIAYAVRS